MKNALILILFSVLAFKNATTSSHNPENELFSTKLRCVGITSPVLSYHYDSVKVTSAYQFENAKSQTTQAFVRILYPIFPNPKLNELVKGAVLSPLGVKYPFKIKFAAAHPALSNMDAISKTASGYTELATNFLKQFEEQASGEDLKAYWYAEINVTVLVNTPGYLACLCKKDYFTGGSHDLYDFNYLNYDIRNHRIITLKSLLKPNKLPQLKVIAERIFRKNEGLTPTQRLKGYFFYQEQFLLPDNFTITGKGLKFLYNYYQIKPFAAGITELVIPFSEIKHFASPGSILAKQIAGY